MTRKITNKALVLLAMLSLPSGILIAQKLPNKQEKGLWLPDNVKIDGTAKEWGGTFQAYNHATEINYSLANDAEYLYLVINAKDITIIKKLIYGSALFTIGDKGSNVSILLPYVPKKIQGGLIMLYTNAGAHKNNNVDSLHKIAADIIEKATVKVKGVAALADSVYSVNNLPATGMKAMAGLDEGYSFTCEIMIPLRYITQFIGKNGSVIYNIKLNGEYYATKTKVAISADGTTMGIYTPGETSVEYHSTPQAVSLSFATDFSGEYTLAKKSSK